MVVVEQNTLYPEIIKKLIQLNYSKTEKISNYTLKFLLLPTISHGTDPAVTMYEYGTYTWLPHY